MLSERLKKIVKYWEPLELEDEIDHVRVRKRREQRILKILDKIGFSWRVYFVAFLGFLASSWSLIAIGIISPALEVIYPSKNRLNVNPVLVLDMVTLSATVVGMILFGHIADRLGRSALYGFELFIVLTAVGGTAFSSEGYIVANSSGDGHRSSMDIYASLFWWRFILGLGIGAEYPMSAVIAAEFASTASRGTTLAAVFLAQPVGRLLAYGLGLGVLKGYTSNTDTPSATAEEDVKLVVDRVWRLVLGLAGVPGIMAIGLRFFIPETPRFYSAIKRDLKRAKESVTKIGSRSPNLASDIESMNSDPEELTPKDTVPWGTKAWSYFFGKTKGWKILFAISIQWAMLDFAFYGTGLDSPATLSALWLDSESTATIPTTTIPTTTIPEVYKTIDNNSVRTLELSSIAAIIGSLLVIPLINIISRKTLYVYTSLMLSFLFAITAVAISQTYAKPTHYTSMVFYAIAQFVFNLGPNTLTFVLAVEIFPTEFRGTCYGIAAASGKIGAIIVRGVIEKVGKGKDGLVTMLSIFAVILFLMAAIARVEPWGIAIPPVQRPRKSGSGTWLHRLVSARLENISLEEIAPWPITEPEAFEETPRSQVRDPDGTGAPVDGNGVMLQLPDLELQDFKETVHVSRS